jgi:hypothetical protein
MNNAIRLYSAADNGLQGLSGTVRYDLFVDFATALKDTEDRSFSVSATTTFSLNASGPEVWYINFDFSMKGRWSLTELGDPFSDQEQITINRITI